MRTDCGLGTAYVPDSQYRMKTNEHLEALPGLRRDWVVLLGVCRWPCREATGQLFLVRICEPALVIARSNVRTDFVRIND